MGSFLKQILEPSEQDALDRLTWMEKLSIDVLEGLSPEDVLPRANVGLPGHLVPRQPPLPAYVTHTGPLVRMLLQQDRLGKASPAEREPSRIPGDVEVQTPVRSRESSTARIEEDSTGIPKDKSSLTPQSVCHRIIFARKHPSTVLPWSSPARSSERE